MGTLGSRVRQIRKALPGRVTQKEFGMRLGVSTAVITSYELDKSTPPPATIKLICVTYKINPRWLETGEGHMEALSYDADLAQEVRTIMRDESEFAIAVMTSLASMPPEWWAAWQEMFERERTKK